MNSAAEVVAADLDFICERLKAELARMSGKALLIVGGAGFLGHYLVQTVLHWNARSAAPPIRVSVFDSFIRGRPGWLDALGNAPNLRVAIHDVTQPLPADFPAYSYVVHAASIASPNYYRLHPIETMDANVNGLRVLLDYGRRRQETGGELEGFLYFSTSEIYGNPPPEQIPTTEDYWGNVSCTGPRACYDESKRYGETLCVNFAQQYGLPVKIARPFNNYGPGLKISDRRVLPDFARDVFAGRDIVLLSDGTPTRTFCYVADAVVGYFKVLVNGRAARPYNIGTEAPEVSIGEVAQMVAGIAAREFGYRGKVVKMTSEDSNYLTDNPRRRCPSIERARSELGYAPQISLPEGLMRSLLWYRDNQTASDD